MWKFFIVLLFAQCLYAQIINVKMVNIYTNSGEINETPLFSNQIGQVYELMLSGGAVSFSDDYNNETMRQQIKMAADTDMDKSLPTDFDHRWRFFIVNPGETIKTENLIFYFEETVRTDKNKNLYKIDYYSLTAAEMRQKYQKSEKRINKYIQENSDDIKLVFSDEKRGIYYLDFQLDTEIPSSAAKEEKDADQSEISQPNQPDIYKPLLGELEPKVKEMLVPFIFDIKYSNSAGSEAVYEQLPQSGQFKLFSQIKKFVNPNSEEIEFVQYNLICKIVPFEYENDILKIELILHGEQSIYNMAGMQQNVLGKTYSKNIEFEKNAVVEVKLPDDWPGQLHIEPEPGKSQKPESAYIYDSSIKNQSLIIRPVKIR